MVAASFSVLARKAVLADCDVDAADLHLLLQPRVRERHEFSGGAVAVRDPEKCTGCGECLEVCRYEAVAANYDIDPVACEGCGFCAEACPAEAITMEPATNGEWYVSDTERGPMVHAALGPAEENSGKLVSVVRERAREIAERSGADYLIADGPPGIGCPVIAAITGADLVLCVTEPTMSGRHDLARVVGVATRLGTRACCVVNKYDINLENTEAIEEWCRENGVETAGRIPLDDSVPRTIAAGKPVVEGAEGPACAAVKEAWKAVEGCLASEHDNHRS